MLFDIPGQEGLRSCFSYKADGFFLFYDITQSVPITEFNNLFELILEASPDAIISLLGNKCDLEDKRKVSTKEAQQFAQERKFLFSKISVKDNINIEFVVYEMIDKIMEKKYENKILTYNLKASEIAAFNCIIFGGKQVKQSLFQKYLANNVYYTYIYRRSNTVNKNIMPIKMYIEEDINKLTNYQNANLFIVIYSITNESSYKTANNAIIYLNLTCLTFIVVIAQKNDLTEQREVSYFQGLQLKTDNELSLFEETNTLSENSFGKIINIFITQAISKQKELLRIKTQIEKTFINEII